MAIPLSLYIHIPWCVRKCPYCDFNSHAAPAALPEAAYAEALLADLDRELAQAGGRPLVSVFFGGGTPSLFSAGTVAHILDGVRQRCTLAADCEITLEANPGTAEAGRFAGYRAAGINRLSIGVQSFDDRCLAALGRIHDGQQAQQALALARQAGFTRINADLMHGLPGQTAAGAVHDLHTAIGSGITHLSWYQLTIEPNTAFHAAPPALPAEPSLAAIQQAGETVLTAAGFRQYEVSAWCRGDDYGRHNLNYWTFGDYLGIGAGAHGKLTLADGRILRRWKTRLPADYLRATAPAGEAVVTAGELPLEFLMNALRLRDGVPAALYNERTGLPLQGIADSLSALRGRGLLVNDPARLATTDTGFRYLDTVLQAFM